MSSKLAKALKKIKKDRLIIPGQLKPSNTYLSFSLNFMTFIWFLSVFYPKDELKSC